MIIFWSVFILLLLVVGILLAIVVREKQRMRNQEHTISEALWERRNLVPLLIELAGELFTGEEREKILGIRKDLNVTIDPLNIAMRREQMLGEHLAQAILQMEINGLLQQDVRYVALKKDLDQIHTEINKRINDYNFLTDRIRQSFVSFAFNKSKLGLLPYV